MEISKDSLNYGAADGSSDHPALVGTTVKTTIERGDAYLSPDIFNVEITLLEIVRGEEAQERIGAAEAGDQLLQTGFEYVLTLVRFGYSRRGKRQGGENYQLTEGQFAAVSPDGTQEYELPSNPLPPETALIGRLFQPGESHEGWILLQVPKEEKEPRLIFKRKHVEGVYGIWGYVWFQLYS